MYSYHRDGQMRFDGNGGGEPVYEPNSIGGAAQSDDPRTQEPPLRISGDAARWDHREGNEDYRQAGDLFRLMTLEKQRELIDNIVDAMSGVPRELQVRQIGHFLQADSA